MICAKRKAITRSYEADPVSPLGFAFPLSFSQNLYPRLFPYLSTWLFFAFLLFLSLVFSFSRVLPFHAPAFAFRLMPCFPIPLRSQNLFPQKRRMSPPFHSFFWEAFFLTRFCWKFQSAARMRTRLLCKYSTPCRDLDTLCAHSARILFRAREARYRGDEEKNQVDLAAKIFASPRPPPTFPCSLLLRSIHARERGGGGGGRDKKVSPRSWFASLYPVLLLPYRPTREPPPPILYQGGSESALLPSLFFSFRPLYLSYHVLQS